MRKNHWCIPVALCFWLILGCSNRRSANADDSTLSVPPAKPLPSTSDTDQQTLRFLQKKLREDADDFIAQNKFAAWHLQHVRETGDLSSLEIALKAARASLATLTEEHN